MAGTLSATKIVTLDELRRIKTPAPGGTRHMPLSHSEIIDRTVEGLASRGYQAVDMKLGLDHGVTRLFGMIDIARIGADDYGQAESALSIGIRHANDRTLSLGMIAGRRIFVCSNMAFSGDMSILRKRHTIGLSLGDEIGDALDRAFQRFDGLDKFIDGLKDRQLDDRTARDVIYRAFMDRKVLAPQYLPNVHGNYFTPGEGWTDCQPRSAWGVYNAFTRVLRDRPLHMTQDGTVELTNFMKSEFRLAHLS
jgi:hypothetical protein